MPGGMDAFEDWLLSQMTKSKRRDARRDGFPILPDEQSARAFLTLQSESGHLKRICEIFNQMAEIWKTRAMTDAESNEMMQALKSELVAWEFNLTGEKKPLISEIQKCDEKSIREIFKACTAEASPVQFTKIEVCLISYWDQGLEIGKFSFPPFAFFSAESLCDLLKVVLNCPDLTAAALRKIMYRKLGLAPFGTKKVIPSEITKRVLALQQDPEAIRKFNSDLMKDISAFGQIDSNGCPSGKSKLL